MNQDEKFKICNSCAKALYKKYNCYRDIDFDELVNVGIIILLERDPPNAVKAYSDAYLYMLHFICKSNEYKKTAKTYEDKRIRHLRPLSTFKTQDCLDLYDAWVKLTDEERTLLKEHFIEELSLQEIAKLHNKKFSHSAGHLVNKALNKLKSILKAW